MDEAPIRRRWIQRLKNPEVRRRGGQLRWRRRIGGGGEAAMTDKNQTDNKYSVVAGAVANETGECALWSLLGHCCCC